MTAIYKMITLPYMNASTVHSPLLYKYASHSHNVAATTSASKKQSVVLHDEAEVRKYLLISEALMRAFRC
jgi:hypothetical protein